MEDITLLQKKIELLEKQKSYWKQKYMDLGEEVNNSFTIGYVNEIKEHLEKEYDS